MAVMMSKNGFTVYVASGARSGITATVPCADGKGIEINALDVTSDVSTARLQMYTCTGNRRLTGGGTSAGASLVYLVGTTSHLTASDKIIINRKNGRAEYGTIRSVGACWIVMNANLTYAVTAGDFVHEVSISQVVTVGSTAKVLYNGVFGQAPVGSPMYIDFSAGTNCSIQNIQGKYI